MLDTAAASIIRAGVPAAGHERIRLRQGLAECLDAKSMFGRDQPFDTIFFSYCLSMVPTWPGALEAALANLKTGGHLVIVDFWDQRDLPGVFAAGLKKWRLTFSSRKLRRMKRLCVLIMMKKNADIMVSERLVSL
jgi:S-adenosylmethionine-diacylgycerolhomoserine-N-methlytransferase